MGRLHGCSERRRSWVARYAKEKTTSATTASLRTSRTARVRGRALQRGRRTRAATRPARLAKTEDEAMMVNAGVARMRRDGRRSTMLDKSPKVTRSEGRGVETTGGARARRGVVCWFRRVNVPDPQRGNKRWHGDVADARGALRGGRSGEKADGYSDRRGRCRDDMRCSGQRDGALRLGEVGGLHGRGDGVSHGGWQQQQWS